MRRLDLAVEALAFRATLDGLLAARKRFASGE